MRAVVVREARPVLTTIDDPVPGPGEVLIRVKATALNRADLLQVRGSYPPPVGAPETLGLELSGEIITVGEGVSRFQAGDRVMALVAGGGYAELAVVDARYVMQVPFGFSDEEAAAIPEAFLTAYSNMVQIGGLIEREIVLIHAGASGVGLAATQIARLIGATVIVTASAAKHEICRAAGANMMIDYRTEPFADRILAEHPGVQLILDMVGAPYWEDNLRVLDYWGRLVFVGLQGGATHNVNFGTIMRKRLTITGSTLRDRAPERKASLVASFISWAMPHFVSGALRPNIWKVMPLEEVEAAHELMRQNLNAGKIVLRVQD